jgi:primary-amine oxidase
LSQDKVESNARLGANVHSNADGDEIIMTEKVALEDEGVKAAIAKLKLPEGSVVIVDPWIYGISSTRLLWNAATNIPRL